MRASGRAALGILLAALLAAGCENSGSPPSCPGDLVARLRFVGVRDGGGCAFAGHAGVFGDGSHELFTADLVYAGATLARLCPVRTDAVALEGGRDGAHVAFTTVSDPVTVPGCACPVVVTERLEGEVGTGDGGLPTFTGRLVDVAVPAPDAGACVPEDAADPAARACGAEADGGCQVRWDVTASP